MPQDRDSGAAGDRFGRETAPKIAAAIDAVMSRPGSNEATWRGRRAVIKCAKVGNPRVGVTYRMLDTLDVIVAAFQRDDGRFDLYELAPSAYHQRMVDTRSRGPSAGRVGQVSRSTFVTLGKPLGTINV